jgi:hypothetical protein
MSWRDLMHRVQYGVEAAAGPSPAARQQAASNLTPTGTSPTSPGWGFGISRLAPFDFAPPPWLMWSRASAMTVPTIVRCRNLIVGAIGGLPLTLWRLNPTGDGPYVEQATAPAPWMARPDPSKTRAWMLSWTVDDLIFEGRAYWQVTSRYANDYPATFRRLAAANVQVGDDGSVHFGDTRIDPASVVEFLATHESLMLNGWRTVTIALELDMAASRFATAEVPAGWLQQTGGEPMSPADLNDLAQNWATMRRSYATAALNQFTEYHEATLDPNKMQLSEARGYQALELARLMNVPAYFVSAPIQGHSLTYNNAEMLREDLIDFACLPYITVIEQVLSGPNVTPGQQFVRLDLNAWMRSPFTTGAEPAANDAQQAFNPPQPSPTGTPATNGAPHA